MFLGGEQRGAKWKRSTGAGARVVGQLEPTLNLTPTAFSPCPTEQRLISNPFKYLLDASLDLFSLLILPQHFPCHRARPYPKTLTHPTSPPRDALSTLPLSTSVSPAGPDDQSVRGSSKPQSPCLRHCYESLEIAHVAGFALDTWTAPFAHILSHFSSAAYMLGI